MNNLGVNYSALGRFDLAEALYKEILEIRRRVQGPEHPNTIFTMNNLAVTYARPGGNHAAAEKLYLATLEMQRRLLGPDHPDTLLTMNNLGLLWTWHAEKLPQAEQMLTQTAQARQRVLGPNHQDTLASWIAVGIAQNAQRKFAEAEKTLHRVCDAYATLKSDFWQRYSCAATLGTSLVGQQRYTEAEPLLLAGYQGLRQREASIPANSRHQIGRAVGWLARLYAAQGKAWLSAEWKQKSEEGVEPAAPPK